MKPALLYADEDLTWIDKVHVRDKPKSYSVEWHKINKITFKQMVRYFLDTK